MRLAEGAMVKEIGRGNERAEIKRLALFFSFFNRCVFAFCFCVFFFFQFLFLLIIHNIYKYIYTYIRKNCKNILLTQIEDTS